MGIAARRRRWTQPDKCSMTVYADSSLPETSRSRTYVGIDRLLRNAWNAVIAAFQAWRIRARQRRELMMLSQPELRDVCLSKADVDSEADKPFWRCLDLPARD
ncbi:MAG TPA: DUF1127 domain-containing protein [Pseudolabrys sp.]